MQKKVVTDVTVTDVTICPMKMMRVEVITTKKITLQEVQEQPYINYSFILDYTNPQNQQITPNPQPCGLGLYIQEFGN